MRCVECTWLEIEQGLPRCGFVNRAIPTVIYGGQRSQANDVLRRHLARARADLDWSRKGECRWAAFTHAGLPVTDEDFEEGERGAG